MPFKELHSTSNLSNIFLKVTLCITLLYLKSGQMTFAKEIDIDPFFIAEHPALDLLNSACAPWGEELDWISNGKGLVNWLVKSKLLNQEEKTPICEKFSQELLDSMAEKARVLREEFRQIVTSGKSEDRLALTKPQHEMLNQALASGQICRSLVFNARSGHYEIAHKRAWHSQHQLLQPLAESIADYLCNADVSRIKKCENPNCTLWFWDTTKNGKRRWCTMSVCGNRMKAAAHRARRKEIQGS